ncbi:MAG: Nif3-like dinuclear metal center hexameric protein [Ruminococcaceae bacterium]|nr:Nif3-like dinuclear metal center hexameric protein [Oscillospiraceae bacterium]
MTTVQNILDFIETVAPAYMKYEWDHIGLNCGHSDAPVTKILLALDPFDEAVNEAKALGAQLLITHHALIWEGGFVNDQTVWGKNVMTLLENGIAHINAHTNLDCAPGGINDVLAETLGLCEISVVNPMGTDLQGRPYGLLRMGTVPQQELDIFLATVKAALGCDGLRYVSGNRQVHRVAVGGGSCASDMMDAYYAGCDTFVTADIKYNQFRTAYELGMNVIDAGHFHTENPAMKVLADKISAAFPELEVILSKKHAECMKFY